ncbi:hypothetical protein [Methylobacter sp. S3L5C]|uniref:hypothetical protein n=1 Tax=Methylobacter sp. S3L5C TaxID=2839024 RepID=UPI001FAB8DAE|nr:hypothetical protein [Methylobacter sp. S3L5C]UOA09507.1 hypothetical protein KKZ03_04220 [Methylobacter sp. S3L5C]
MATSLCVRITLLFQWDVALLVAWPVLPGHQLIAKILTQEVISNPMKWIESFTGTGFSLVPSNSLWYQDAF